MKRGKSFLLKFAVTAVLATASAAWAQNCPASPSYAPDFTSNQSCMTLNGSATFPAAGSAASITSWSGSSGIVTFQATNSFIVGEGVTLSGFTTSTFFNGVSVSVLATGLSDSQFEVAFSNFTGSGDTENGVATPLNVLQLTPNAIGQAGSGWFNSQQTVGNGFSTTFSFALTNTSTYIADGFAFVIQNSATTALGPTGCGIGFGGGGCTTATPGIAYSLAVEFNTYPNQGFDPLNPANNETSNNSVSIQSCGTSANTVDTTPTSGCNYGNNAALPITLADGNVHSVTVSYTLHPPASATNCFSDSTPQPCLDVILDGVDLFPLGVSVNLTTLLSLNNGPAWVGFTAATGGGDNTQDILSWTFASQSQSQTGTVTNNGQTTTFPFNGGFMEGKSTTGFDYGAQETDTQLTEQMVVTAIPMTSAACDALLQGSPFAGAHCFVYQNGGGPNVDEAVMFAVTCPPNGSCGSPTSPFDAFLTSQFGFLCGPVDNLAPLCTSFGFPNVTALTGFPAVGFLKGTGPDPDNPCTPYPNNNPSLFQSNQIVSFELGDLSSKPIKGSSGGGTSCWAPTYETPGEVPTVTITQPVANQVYRLNETDATTVANYNCMAANAGSSSSTGPYLTVPTGDCTATDSPGGSVANGAQFDTSTLGLHTFTVQVMDSAFNTNSKTVTYYVQGPLLTVSPSSFNFGIENLGLDLDPILVTVKNIGTSAAAISGASITDGPGTKPIDFTAVNLCPASLAAGKSCAVGVVFLAGTVGSLSATLNISDNAPGSPQQVTLAATVINPQIKFSPSSLSFGTVKVGNPSVLNVTVSNPGTTPLNIMNVGVKGTNAADFLAANGCPGSLGPGGVCMISVTFTPSATGSRSASLVVTDNTTSGTQAVPLSGKGN